MRWGVKAINEQAICNHSTQFVLCIIGQNTENKTIKSQEKKNQIILTRQKTRHPLSRWVDKYNCKNKNKNKSSWEILIIQMEALDYPTRELKSY
jgi:hypothetical protein